MASSFERHLSIDQWTCPHLSLHAGAVSQVEEQVRAVHGVEPDWERYAAAVRRRRQELGLTQEQVTALGGPSTGVQRQVEGAMKTSYREMGLYALDRALGWSPGAHLGVLAGKEPHALVDAKQFRAHVVRPQDPPERADEPPTERELLAALSEVPDEKKADAVRIAVEMFRTLGR